MKQKIKYPEFVLFEPRWTNYLFFVLIAAFPVYCITFVSFGKASLIIFFLMFPFLLLLKRGFFVRPDYSLVYYVSVCGIPLKRITVDLNQSKEVIICIDYRDGTEYQLQVDDNEGRKYICLIGTDKESAKEVIPFFNRQGINVTWEGHI